MPRKKKELTPYEKYRQAFYDKHYPTLRFIGECDMGDHVDFDCICGVSYQTYASESTLIEHMLEVLYESNTV